MDVKKKFCQVSNPCCKDALEPDDEETDQSDDLPFSVANLEL